MQQKSSLEVRQDVSNFMKTVYTQQSTTSTNMS